MYARRAAVVYCLLQAEQLRTVGRHYLLQDGLPETGSGQEHTDLDLIEGCHSPTHSLAV